MDWDWEAGGVVFERSFSRGRISALSAAGGWRRGRVDRTRVVARRRWEQKVQWRVWIGSVGFWISGADVGGVDILRVGGGGWSWWYVWEDLVRVLGLQYP